MRSTSAIRAPIPSWPRQAHERSLEAARGLALAVRAAAAGKSGPDDQLRLDDVLELAGIKLRKGDLQAGDGGREALLLPVLGDAFEIVVDPTPRGGWVGHTSRQRRAIARARTRFRVAHEIGHTFFYRRRDGERPVRIVPPGTVAEESFCDRFAEELLIPDAAILRSPITAEQILSLAVAFDVSVEVAARAAARRHPLRPKVALYYWPNPRSRDAEPTLQWSNACEPPHSTLEDAAGFSTSRRQLVLVET